MSLTILNKKSLFKILSLFSVVRGYNIVFIILAQLISATYIFSENKTFYEIISDYNVWLIIFCSAFSISAGYIINNIYDSKKDLINRPLKTLLENQISGRTKFLTYVFFNSFTLIFAYLISLKAFLFFLLYIIGIILYSIRISRYPFFGNIFSVLLSITPFFAIILYYKNYSLEIISHSIFLFFIVLIREVIKDLENFVGDFTLKYNTIPVKYGEKISKYYINLLVVIVFVVSIHIIQSYDVYSMKYYHYFVYVFFTVFMFFLYKKKSKETFQKLHNALKLLIILGIFSVMLLEI
jgi:4-hydroxybenzoate polyprenyltransferase